MFEEIVIVRGGGDIASGVIHRLHRSGFRVIVLEIEKPTMVRRTVSFGNAIYEGQYTVEGVKAVRVGNNKEDIFNVLESENIPILIDKDCDILRKIQADILVDATLAKKNLGITKDMAGIVIGVGPGFNAGVNVDAVVETYRGHNLGKVIFQGTAKADTGTPGAIMGYDKERVLRAPISGNMKNVCKIGDTVKKDDIIAYIEDGSNKETVKAYINGVLRGLIKDGLYVKKGLKIGDIDPRNLVQNCYSISDKARAVGGGVLEAVLYLKNRRDYK